MIFCKLIAITTGIVIGTIFVFAVWLVIIDAVNRLIEHTREDDKI